jgi:oligosaccharide repeat unit polymerase
VSAENIFQYVIFFLFGTIALTIASPKKISVKNNYPPEKRSKSSNPKFFAWVYSAPALIFFIAMMFISIRAGLSLQDLRNVFFFGDGSVLPFLFGEVFVHMSAYIGLGYYLLVSYLVRYLIRGVAADRDAALIVAMSLFLFDSAAGGRMAIFYQVLIFLCAKILINNRPVKIFRGAQSKVILFTVFLGFVTVTALRLQSGSTGFLEFLYAYLVGPIFLMNQGLGDPNGLLGNPDVRFGMSFMSVDWIVVGFLKLAGFDLRTLFDIADYHLSVGYYLNDQYGINAHFTAVFYYLIDYGIFSAFGIAITVFFSIAISRVSYNPQRQITVLVFIAFALVLATRENFLNSPTFLFTLLLLYAKPMNLRKC